MVHLSQPYVITGKTVAFTIWAFVGRVMCLLFSTLKRFLGSSSLSCRKAIFFWFHGCSHHLQRFRSQEGEICHYFHLFPFYLPWSNGAGGHDLNFFLIFSFKPALSLSSFPLLKRLFSCSWLLAIRVVPPTYLRLLTFHRLALGNQLKFSYYRLGCI